MPPGGQQEVPSVLPAATAPPPPLQCPMLAMKGGEARKKRGITHLLDIFVVGGVIGHLVTEQLKDISLLVAVAFSLADNHHFIKQKQIPVPESEEETRTQQPCLHIPSPQALGKGLPSSSDWENHASQRGQLVPRCPTWRLGQEGSSSLARVANFWPQEVANGCLPLPAKGVSPLRFCISNRPSQMPPKALLLVSSWAPFKSHLLSCHGAQRWARSTWAHGWWPRASHHPLSGPKKDRQHPPFALVQLWGGGK